MRPPLPLLMLIAAGTALVLPLAFAPASRPASAAAVGWGPVAVVVKIPIPASIHRDALPEQFHRNIGLYKNLPGLVRKYFIVSDDNKFGGIYLYESRKLAEEHFSAAWKADVLKRLGARPEVEYLEAPVRIVGTNATPLEDL